MSFNRCSLGALFLWATLCVVLLACAWPAAARATGSDTAPGAQALARAGLDADADGALRQPSAPCPDLPVGDTPAVPEASGEPEAATASALNRLPRPVWVAVVPLWPSDALRWQRLEPSLRLNPGHAPPRT